MKCTTFINTIPRNKEINESVDFKIRIIIQNLSLISKITDHTLRFRSYNNASNLGVIRRVHITLGPSPGDGLILVPGFSPPFLGVWALSLVEVGGGAAAHSF